MVQKKTKLMLFSTQLKLKLKLELSLAIFQRMVKIQKFQIKLMFSAGLFSFLIGTLCWWLVLDQINFRREVF